jgi:Mg2+ and Co2+ transporter CorA
MKALTIMGAVFIPLAYMAARLGMSDPYIPRSELFWMYFVISFPLIGLIVLGYYALELGYADGRMHWSFLTAVHSIKEKIK